ncbi:MAG: transporter [Burkholderiales bacterium]|nr:transporter [Burkholderiales bacterium]
MKGNTAVISLVALAHGTSHFFQLVTAPLFPFIKDDLGVSYAALGFVMALFYTVSAICQPIAGFVVDRFGGRTVMIVGIGLQAAGTLIAALSGSYAQLVVGSLLAGVGNSVFHPADFSILNSRVETGRLGHAYSAHGVAGSLGYAAAPAFSGTLGVLFGWHAALLAAAGVGLAVFLLLLANARRLHSQESRPSGAKAAGGVSARVLFAAPVVMCFLYFAIYAAGLAGLQSFGVAAMAVQYGVTAALASSALTAYMGGSACGIFAGGFIAGRTERHDLVAASGLAIGAAAMLLIAVGQLPGSALPMILGCAGLAIGATGPSRDMIVRAATPSGATGRVYGFVYSGLDVGQLATPVFFGWLMDSALPQGVFYGICGFTALAIITVLQLPGRRPVTQRI